MANYANQQFEVYIPEVDKKVYNNITLYHPIFVELRS